MQNILNKLIIALGVLGIFGSIHAMEPVIRESETLVGRVKGLPEDAQRQVALSMIGDFLLNQQEPITLGHDNVVYATAISPDSQHIVTGSFDGMAKIWSKNGKLEHILKGHQGLVNLVAISSDNAYVATGVFDQRAQEIDRMIRIWDTKTGQLIHTLGEKEINRHLASITALAISPDNSYIVTGSEDHMVKLWDMKTGILLTSFGGVNNQDNWINDIKISADSIYVTIATNNGEVILLHARNGRFVLVPRHGSKIITMAMAGDKLITGSWDGTAKLWNTMTGELVYKFGNGTNKVLSVDISHDGAYVAVAPADDERTAKIYDANTGVLVHTLGGTQGPTYCIKKIKISSDNKYVATASEDNTVKVWDLKKGNLLYTFIGHTNKLESLQISPDVSYAVSGSWDNTAKIWSLLLNLNGPEFNKSGDALFWIKHNLTIPQADLIARAYAATRDGESSVMSRFGDDGKVFLTLPDYVRLYLLKHLNIKLVKPLPAKK